MLLGWAHTLALALLLGLVLITHLDQAVAAAAAARTLVTTAAQAAQAVEDLGCF